MSTQPAAPSHSPPPTTLSTTALAAFTALHPPQPRSGVLRYIKDQSTRSYTPLKLASGAPSSAVDVAETLNRIVAHKQQQQQLERRLDPERRREAFALVLHTEEEKEEGRKENSSPRKKREGEGTGTGIEQRKVSLVKAMKPRMTTLSGGGGNGESGTAVLKGSEKGKEKEKEKERKRGRSPILVSRRAAEKAQEEKAEEKELENALEEVGQELSERVTVEKRKRDASEAEGRGETKQAGKLREVPSVVVEPRKSTGSSKGKSKATKIQDADEMDEIEELEARLEARKLRRRAKALIVKDRTQSSKAVGKAAAAKVKASNSRKKKTTTQHDDDEEDDNEDEDEQEERSGKKRRKTTLEDTNRLLQEGGKAKNVRESRLTLVIPKLGLFNKGVASGRTKVPRQLPDLAFSELAFLNAPRTANHNPAKRLPSSNGGGSSSASGSEVLENQSLPPNPSPSKAKPKSKSKSIPQPKPTSHHRLPKVTYGSKGKHASNSRHRPRPIFESSSTSSREDVQSLPSLPRVLQSAHKKSSTKVASKPSESKTKKKGATRPAPSAKKKVPSPPTPKRRRLGRLPLPSASEASLHSAYSLRTRARDRAGDETRERDPSPIAEEVAEEEDAVMDTRSLWKGVPSASSNLAPTILALELSSMRMASTSVGSFVRREEEVEGGDSEYFLKAAVDGDESLIWSAGDMNRIREAKGKGREREGERGSEEVGSSLVDRLLGDMEEAEEMERGMLGEEDQEAPMSVWDEVDGILDLKEEVEVTLEERWRESVSLQRHLDLDLALGGVEEGTEGYLGIEGDAGGVIGSGQMDDQVEEFDPIENDVDDGGSDFSRHQQHLGPEWSIGTMEGQYIQTLFQDSRSPQPHSSLVSTLANVGRSTPPFPRPFTDQIRSETSFGFIGTGRFGGALETWRGREEGGGGGLTNEEREAMRNHWYRAVP